MNTRDQPRYQRIRQVLWLALALNVLVAVGKLAYGILFDTLSMVADGMHSFTDAGASVMGLVSIYVASKPSDEDHHYGHDKFETLAAFGIGFFIMLSGWEVLQAAYHRFLEPADPRYHFSGLIIMAVGTMINVSLSFYERHWGKKLNSEVLTADAQHTASDAWVSVGVVTSILCIRNGWPIADVLASTFIGGFLLMMAWRLIKTNALDLTDAAFLDMDEIARIACAVDGVDGCHRIRTRGRKGRAFVDLHIQVPPETNTRRAHDLVHEVEDQLLERMPGIADVLIHTEPYPDEDTNPRHRPPML